MDGETINYDVITEKDDNSCQYKDKNETTPDNSNSILPMLTTGVIGAGIYYFKKKKK